MVDDVQRSKRRPPARAAGFSARLDQAVSLAVVVLLLLCLTPSVTLAVQPASSATSRQDDSPAAATPESDGNALPPAVRRLADLEGVPAPTDVTAQAVYAADIDAGMPLLALNATERRAPASTAKIVTALLAAQVLDLDQVVTIEESDTVDTAVYSNMQLQVGDQLTVRDLLIGLLLPSGNDAAMALARVAGAELPGGDQDPVQAFLDAMNSTAQGLGAVNSNFLHPAGEDTEGQYTTALDLAILAKALLDNETLATIVATRQWDITITGPNARTYTVYNTNQLLGETGIIGVKTGSTEAAGACLVAAAAYTETNRVVIVVLGSQLQYDESGVVSVDARFSDTLSVIRAINATYTWLTPADIANVPGLAEEMAAWGVTLGEVGTIVVPTEAIGSITYRLELGPPAEPGDQVGRVLFFVGEKQIAEVPVVQV